jgi:hypothetical protein
MADLDRIRGRETFVGRSRELAEICAGVDGVVAGRGSLFTLAGEPGVGKSRLGLSRQGPGRTRGVGQVLGARRRAALLALGASHAGARQER